MRRLAAYLTILFIITNNLPLAFCQPEKTFKTKYTIVHYTQDKDINDFIWRLGGDRFEFSGDTALASNRIDRIVERVQTILDMHIQPKKSFNINIYLRREPISPDTAACYEYKTKSIYISVDHSSEGVFAHEVAHAVINNYFTTPPPSKIQEILTQYVDKYLWSDY